MYDVVLLIVQTSAEEIERRFEVGLRSKAVQTNIVPFKNDDGKYALKVIDITDSKTNTTKGLAQQETVYDDLETLKTTILDLIKFIKHDFTEEGMFLVEHILLRPNIFDDTAPVNTFMPICTDDCDEGCGIDPYSFRVSIVLPGYTYRFANPDFRTYMENIIREELPAHIVPRICWVGNRRGEVLDEDNDLFNFENAYKDYLEAKTMLDQEQPTTGKNEHRTLITAMTQLNTIYPEGRLMDCSDESDDIEGRVILGQTNLGTLKTESNGGKNEENQP